MGCSSSPPVVAAKRRPRRPVAKARPRALLRPEPESPARGLRRTAVGQAPRATSTPPRAALPPRLASYNGTVGRASTARLSPPRHPTPLLSGTFLTSAGRPPLRRILATEGWGITWVYAGSCRRTSENSYSTHFG